MKLSPEQYSALIENSMQKGIEQALETLGRRWGDGSWDAMDETIKAAITLGISSGVLATVNILDDV